jgi:hypothetical protein
MSMLGKSALMMSASSMSAQGRFGRLWMSAKITNNSNLRPISD